MSSEDFGVLLNMAFGAFKEGLHAAMMAEGFDDVGSSFGYVFRLLDGHPASLREVARHLAITPQGALKIVDDMVAKGYVERLDHPGDGRIKLLSLTVRGRAALSSARRHHKRFEKALAGRIGAANAQATRAALEDIVRQSSAAPTTLPRPA
jgi:DNA-binding MarR family transcriptional regulator